DKREFDKLPGLATLVNTILGEKPLEESTFSGSFASLLEAVMADLHAMCRLQALEVVTENMVETERRVRMSTSHGEGSGAGATGGDGGAGRNVAVTDTPLVLVTKMIEEKKTDINSRVAFLTTVATVSRYRSILQHYLPENPRFSFPSDIAPPQAPTSAEGYSVEEIHLPSCASPVAALRLFVNRLTAWKKEILAVGNNLEQKWWVEPEDPEEAMREHNRTVLTFELAAATAAQRVLMERQKKWNLQELARVERNPQRKTALEEASRILEKCIDEERQQKIESSKAYAWSLWDTASKRVKNKLGPWVSSPDSSHCPEIRALMEKSDEPPSDEAGAGGS
ncbi:toxoplasma gondii family E protein, partial [Toxoplasma gondii GAB2-2007-GAL-DOM2]